MTLRQCQHDDEWRHCITLLLYPLTGPTTIDSLHPNTQRGRVDGQLNSEGFAVFETLGDKCSQRVPTRSWPAPSRISRGQIKTWRLGARGRQLGLSAKAQVKYRGGGKRIIEFVSHPTMAHGHGQSIPRYTSTLAHRVDFPIIVPESYLVPILWFGDSNSNTWLCMQTVALTPTFNLSLITIVYLRDPEIHLTITKNSHPPHQKYAWGRKKRDFPNNPFVRENKYTDQT